MSKILVPWKWLQGNMTVMGDGEDLSDEEYEELKDLARQGGYYESYVESKRGETLELEMYPYINIRCEQRNLKKAKVINTWIFKGF